MDIGKQFISHCEHVKGFSPRSLIRYRHDLNRFLSYIDVASPEEITLHHIDEFIAHLKQQPGVRGRRMSQNTIRCYLVIIRSFLKFCLLNGCDVIDPQLISTPKLKTTRYCLTKHDIDKLRSEILVYATEQEEYRYFCVGYRDRAMLEFLYSTGLRVSEMTSLNRDQIDLDDRSVHVIGKGGKQRYVFISEEASEWLKRYFHMRTDTHAALFITVDLFENGAVQGSGRMSSKSVMLRLVKYGKRAGILRRVTPHIIRHTFATHMLNSGVNLRAIQMMLGHESIETTQLYTHLAKGELQRIHEVAMG